MLGFNSLFSKFSNNDDNKYQNTVVRAVIFNRTLDFIKRAKQKKAKGRRSSAILVSLSMD
jgi:hypothetical protein